MAPKGTVPKMKLQDQIEHGAARLTKDDVQHNRYKEGETFRWKREVATSRVTALVPTETLLTLIGSRGQKMWCSFVVLVLRRMKKRTKLNFGAAVETIEWLIGNGTRNGTPSTKENAV